MPGRTWQPTKRGARDLEQHIREGTVVYTVADIATNLAPFEDSQLYTAHEFTHRSSVTGKWMTGHLTAQTLLAQAGTVYERPPARMRGMHEPAPQVAGPLGNDYRAYLDEPELRGLGKRARDTSDPRMRRI